MRKLGVLSFGVTMAGLVFFACVGDSTPVGGQGQLDGPCYPGDTCNAGLKCDLSGGSGKCIVAPTNDAAIETGTPDAASDSSGVCVFTPTGYPCKDIQQPTACFGLSQGCTVTGCGSTDVRWECNSPNQCNGTPCCVPAEAVLTPSVACTQGTLQLAAADAGGQNGASCKQGAACPAGETQLCQSNAQCPKGKVCGPVKVTGGPSSMNNYTIGACGPG